MNLRSLFSAAAVLASLAVPALANAQQVPFMRDTHARTVNAPSRGAQRGFDGPVQMQRQVEARRNEEMRRAQMARGAERFQRAEDGRRGDAERHGNGAPGELRSAAAALSAGRASARSAMSAAARSAASVAAAGTELRAHPRLSRSAPRTSSSAGRFAFRRAPSRSAVTATATSCDHVRDE